MLEDTDVQPEGQGDGVDTFGYDLSSVPEDHRDLVGEHIQGARKHWDGEATKKFQEHAEYRKQWEPYEELGVNNLDPQDLRALIEFGQVAGDETQFNEWLSNMAAQRGLVPGDQPGVIPGDQPGSLDSQEQLKALVDQQIAPIREHYEAQQEQVRMQEAQSDINSTLDALEKKNGAFDREMVCGLALKYPDEQAEGALQKAYAEFEQFRGNIEKSLLERKAAQPDTPERGGAPAMGTKPVTDWGEAGQMARERFRQAQSA